MGSMPKGNTLGLAIGSTVVVAAITAAVCLGPLGGSLAWSQQPGSFPPPGGVRPTVPQGVPHAATGGTAGVTAATGSAPAEGVIATVIPSGSYQQVIVIDPKRSSMAVYHVDAVGGQISLKSVRSIGWDLEISAFNTVEPQPQEIRALLNRQR